MSHATNLVATRQALHAVAEHVLSTALQAATGRIGLRAAPGGFTTPPFGDAPDRLRLDGVELVVEQGGSASRHELTTLGAAAAAAEVDLGHWHDLYPAATPADADFALIVDPAEATLLADWFALADAGLARVRADTAADNPSIAQLWPEHFDLAIVVRQCNVGASPGDRQHPEPYLYLGPFDPAPFVAAGGFWNEPFGASLPWRPKLDVDEAVSFWHEGLARLGAATSPA